MPRRQGSDGATMADVLSARVASGSSTTVVMRTGRVHTGRVVALDGKAWVVTFDADDTILYLRVSAVDEVVESASPKTDTLEADVYEDVSLDEPVEEGVGVGA